MDRTLASCQRVTGWGGRGRIVLDRCSRTFCSPRTIALLLTMQPTRIRVSNITHFPISSTLRRSLLQPSTSLLLSTMAVISKTLIFFAVSALAATSMAASTTTTPAARLDLSATTLASDLEYDGSGSSSVSRFVVLKKIAQPCSCFSQPAAISCAGPWHASD
jgi:hypothetical protein